MVLLGCIKMTVLGTSATNLFERLDLLIKYVIKSLT